MRRPDGLRSTVVLRDHWRALPDASLKEVARSAGASVDAFARATSSSGSLLQSWIESREVVEYDHYPPGDIVDETSGSQFYYHSHRGGVEHGHLHLFWHARSDGRRRPLMQGRRRWVNTEPSHLFALSLDAKGLPIAIFTVNRWVTDGHWFDAATTLDLVDRFRVSAQGPHLDSGAWLTEFVRMYRPLVERALRQRDQRLARARDQGKVLDNRRLEVLSHIPIDWSLDLDALEEEVGRRARKKAGRPRDRQGSAHQSQGEAT
jgi:hypothetical protein